MACLLRTLSDRIDHNTTISITWQVGWAYESTGREFLGYTDSFLGMEGWLERVAREAKGITVCSVC